MALKTVSFSAAAGLLKNPQSSQRRSAAKRLRKLRDPRAGPALLTALKKELQDPRTWETQYQMIMALGESNYREALPFLQELAGRSFEATMVYVAIGDAIVRLGRSAEHDAGPVIELMRSGNSMLADGAFRAMAMLRIKPDPHPIHVIIDFVSSFPREDPLRFWVAAAAPGWKEPKVESFLRECSTSARNDLREAAVDALAGKYRAWKSL